MHHAVEYMQLTFILGTDICRITVVVFSVGKQEVVEKIANFTLASIVCNENTDAGGNGREILKSISIPLLFTSNLNEVRHMP